MLKAITKNGITKSNVINTNGYTIADNKIITTKRKESPYYDRPTGNLSKEEVAKLPIRGYYTHDYDVDSYFANIVSEWADDDTIIPFGWIMYENSKVFLWGNDKVVFYATKKELLRIQKEVQEYGYCGQLSCFGWDTILDMVYNSNQKSLLKIIWFSLNKEIQEYIKKITPVNKTRRIIKKKK